MEDVAIIIKFYHKPQTISTKKACQPIGIASIDTLDLLREYYLFDLYFLCLEER